MGKLSQTKLKIIYYLWIFTNVLVLLLSGSLGGNKNIQNNNLRNFYPLKGRFDNYDYTELLFYTALPLFIWYIVKLIKRDREENKKNNFEKEMDLNYFKDVPFPEEQYPSHKKIREQEGDDNLIF